MYQSYYPIGTAGHRAYSHAYGAAAYAPVTAAPAAVSETPGGINAVLDYEPRTMAAFLLWCAFGMLGQNRSPSAEFDGVMVSILHATRLPKSTIVVALEYLNQRFASTATSHMPEHEVFIKVVVALVLANKFNDDNTFTNRLWCGATGLTIEVLNAEEATWLREVHWRLSVVPYAANIATLDECWATWLAKYAAPCQAPPSPPYSPVLSPYTAFSAPYVPYSAPLASPLQFAPGWGRASYVTPHHSIWAYTPPQYQYVPQNEYYGYSNGYSDGYFCSMASC